jgi:hypothetical protein
MRRIDAPRHQLIYTLLTRRPEAISEVSVALWEKLADQLITIIGEGGFDSLYSRSLHLCGKQFPWLTPAEDSTPPSSRFLPLKLSLDDHDNYLATEASVALLTTFVDILAMLIGELLTSSILRSAWGADVSETAAKDSDNA